MASKHRLEIWQWFYSSQSSWPLVSGLLKIQGLIILLIWVTPLGMKKSFMLLTSLGRGEMSKLLLLATLIAIAGCSSKSIQEECYPNPDNKATYGVPQKWSCWYDSNLRTWFYYWVLCSLFHIVILTKTPNKQQKWNQKIQKSRMIKKKG